MAAPTDRRQCDAALGAAFEILGKRWNGVILGVLSEGDARFADLARAIELLSDSVLSARLVELAKLGLIERAVDPGPPIAVSYRLTESGRALIPALDELKGWAETHLGDIDPADCPAS